MLSVISILAPIVSPVIPPKRCINLCRKYKILRIKVKTANKPIHPQSTIPNKVNAITIFRLGTVGFVNGNATVMRNGRLVSEYGETEDVSTKTQQAALVS